MNRFRDARQIFETALVEGEAEISGGANTGSRRQPCHGSTEEACTRTDTVLRIRGVEIQNVHD